jgi:hypothetical protein
MSLVIILSIVGLWVIITYLGRNDLHAPAPVYAVAAPTQSAPITYDIVYKIQTNGCTDFDTTYQLPDGTSQSSTYTCSSTEVGHFRAHSGQFVYLSVQNLGDYNASASANFSCVIELEGMPFKQVHANGSYHIASCDGTVP